MPTIRIRSRVHSPITTTFAFFDDPANLGLNMPPPVSIRPVRVEPSPPRAGTEIEFRYGIGPLQRRWLVRYLEHVPGERIVDETLSGPMRLMLHSHTFTAARDGGTWIEDRIDYHVGPSGPLGMFIDAIAGLVMRAVFVWRVARQRRILGS